MTLRGPDVRWMYSGAVNVFDTQTDPLLSLGNRSPNEQFPGGVTSAPYRQETLDANATVPNVVNDTETDTASSDDPAVDDWLIMVDGPAARDYAKITAVDYGTGDITLDRALTALPQTGDTFRTSRVENLFPNVTLQQASDGLTDHRMIYSLKKNAGGETNHRYYILPIKPNGCDIELMAGGDGSTNALEPLIASGTTDPFTPFGVVDSLSPGNATWVRAEKAELMYGEDAATPRRGSLALSTDESGPIWIRRTVPPSATAGECVFALFDYVDDAISQDAGADPNPFHTGFIFSWTIPEQTYSVTITQDRIAYTNGAVRITATVTNGLGAPAVGINAWLVILSGPGSINTDLDGRTDANGQIKGVYTSPSTVTVPAVIQLIIPTNPEI